jgi:anti-sigma28 factor (negative regulator of flagellin synthesis)
MRVNNQSTGSVAAETSAGATQKVGQQGSQPTTGTTGVAHGDQASLSSASNLVALAKSATSSDRQARISALTQQVQSGSYHGSTGQAGKAMVQELLQTSTSAAH